VLKLARLPTPPAVAFVQLGKTGLLSTRAIFCWLRTLA